jgi:hypothetical protein
MNRRRNICGFWKSEGRGKGDTVDTAGVDLKRESMMEEIGYDRFIEICKVGNPKNWHGMAVKTDGVWVELPPDDALLFPGERAVLSAHPQKDLTIPALKFPCTDKDLRIFLEWVAVGMAETYLRPEVTNIESGEVRTADAYLGTEVTKVSEEKRKGGRPKGSLYEAVEFAYKKFRDEGNTEILRPGKVAEFLDRLKDLADGENQNISDYVAERIEIVKKRNGSFTITTQERVIKKVKGREIIEKKTIYSTGDISKLLTALRKSFPLQA